MTNLNPTSLVAIIVPKDAKNIRPLFGNLAYNQKGRVIETGIDISKYSILAEVTANEINFDVEPYVKKVTLGYWIDYCNPHKRHDIMSSTPKESFYSLLQANGLYFVNPYAQKEGNYWGDTETLLKWREAENKLIKGKLVILKPIV